MVDMVCLCKGDVSFVYRHGNCFCFHVKYYEWAFITAKNGLGNKGKNPAIM